MCTGIYYCYISLLAVYGINTGFGRFAAVPISKDNVRYNIAHIQ